MHRHPVETLLREHTYLGREPTPADLDELALSTEDRDAVQRAATDALRLRSDGHQAEADRLAKERAQVIIAGLPSSQRQADYLADPDPLLHETDPAKLAAAVSRTY